MAGPRRAYINALLKETIRWTGIAPLGNPHATTADDVYNGYFIPKGTIVIGNSWYAPLKIAASLLSEIYL